MEIKEAFEVYSLVGGGYNKRHLHGYAWTKKVAHELAESVRPKRYHVGLVHLVKVGNKWHRIHVVPVETISGPIEEASESRVSKDDIPERLTPAINYQINDFPPKRLSPNLEKAVDALAEYGHDCDCKLFTLRTGGRLPLMFRIRDLILSDNTQKQVFDWLNYEIEFRNKNGEKNESA